MRRSYESEQTKHPPASDRVIGTSCIDAVSNSTIEDRDTYKAINVKASTVFFFEQLAEVGCSFAQAAPLQTCEEKTKAVIHKYVKIQLTGAI